eukprot:gene11998-5398_t
MKNKQAKRKNQEKIEKNKKSKSSNMITVNSSKGVEISNEYFKNSVQKSKEFFEWMISPKKIEEFQDEFWEKKPLLISRNDENFYDGFLSLGQVKEVLKNNNLNYTIDLDVTKYIKGVRNTYNPKGKVDFKEAWKFYEQGCSLRFLSPQKQFKQIWKSMSILDEYFGAVTGCNVYLTPPNSQGFAPHYDDVEVFIIQVEGSKFWRVYPFEKSPAIQLARFSSKNFSPKDIPYKPIIDVELKAGDMLYLPRGTIHQGRTEKNHSLHLSLSQYQLNSWSDVFELSVPNAIKASIENDVEFRKGLPINFSNFMGISKNNGTKESERDNFKLKFQELYLKLLENIDLDEICDTLSNDFQHGKVPPVIENEEMKRTFKHKQNQLSMNSEIRLIRKKIFNMSIEEDNAVILYSSENSLLHKHNDPQEITFSLDFCEIVEQISEKYPEFVKISEIQKQNEVFNENLLIFLNQLYKKQLLIEK